MITSDQRVLIELRNTAFHLRKVIVMLQNREYCLDIIRESRIVQQLLKRADSQILTYHLERCVRRMLESEDEDRKLKEIIVAFKRSRA